MRPAAISFTVIFCLDSAQVIKYFLNQQCNDFIGKMLSESTMVHGGPYVHEITNGLDKRTNIVNNRERDSNNHEQS